MRLIPYILAGLVVFGGTIALYFDHGGAVPSGPQDWANFGTYVGGTAGPLLSFVALIAIVRTMHLQRETLELERERQLAGQHLRWLDALYGDMVGALDMRVSSDATLREVLDGDVPAGTIDQQRLASRLDNLLQLLAQYCQAVALYRDNISEFFDLRIYVDRGGRLLDAIKPFHGYFGSMVLPTIEFCDMHLKGVSERATAEAMTRSSRRA